MATLKNATLASLATPAGKANATAVVDAFQAKVNATVLAHASVMDQLAAAKPNKTTQFAALRAAVNKTAGVDSLAAKVNATDAAWAAKVKRVNATLKAAVASKNATLTSAVARKNATLTSALARKNATLANALASKNATLAALVAGKNGTKTAFGGVSFLQTTDDSNLLIRQHLSDYLVNAYLGRNRSGGCLVVAGEQHGGQSEGAQRSDRLLACRFDGVAHHEQALNTLIPTRSDHGVAE